MSLQGHVYAAQAEEYAAKGQVDKAAEAHRKAAGKIFYHFMTDILENYLKAQETTENTEALLTSSAWS
jgi:hypothetical protein